MFDTLKRYYFSNLRKLCPNMKCHVNSKRGLSSGCPKFLVKKRCFSTQNKSCMAKIFWCPQKAFLMLEKIVFKFEVPTPRGSWVMSEIWVPKKLFFKPKAVIHGQNFPMPLNALLLILENIVETSSPNSKRGLSYRCPKFWVKKRFSTHNQSCITNNFRHS